MVSTMTSDTVRACGGWRLDLDIHPVLAYFDRKAGRAISETRGRLPVVRVVVIPVPRTAEPSLLDRAFPERTALVGAVIVEGAVAAVAVGERQAAMAGDHSLHSTIGQFIEVGHFVPGRSFLYRSCQRILSHAISCLAWR